MPPCMNDPQPEGSHGKPHRTTKILSYARRRGGGVAGGGPRATDETADHRIDLRSQHYGFNNINREDRMRRQLAAFVASCAFIASSGTPIAHHSFAMFDQE